MCPRTSCVAHLLHCWGKTAGLQGVTCPSFPATVPVVDFSFCDHHINSNDTQSHYRCLDSSNACIQAKDRWDVENSSSQKRCPCTGKYVKRERHSSSLESSPQRGVISATSRFGIYAKECVWRTHCFFPTPTRWLHTEWSSHWDHIPPPHRNHLHV